MPCGDPMFAAFGVVGAECCSGRLPISVLLLPCQPRFFDHRLYSCGNIICHISNIAWMTEVDKRE